MTFTVGYFNPNTWPIYIEVSEVNVKCELKPGQYIRDRQGNYINDPVFEDYVQPKGLSRAMGQQQVQVRYVPRVVKTTRPPNSVTQATGFVRDSSGQVVPVYASQGQPPAEVPANKIPIVGMTVAKARELGLIGKPRLLPEDYGVTDNTGAPSPSKDLPSMKYSLESPPRIRTAAPLTPELMMADPNLPRAVVVQRQAIQRTLNTAAAAISPDDFNPNASNVLSTIITPDAPGILAPAQEVVESQEPLPPVAPPGPAPLHIKAPREPVRMAPGHTASGAQAQPQRVLPRRVASVVVQDPPAGQPEDTSGTLQPLQEGEVMPEPTLDAPQATPQAEASGRRFVCGADGKSFKYRSELERYVRRKFPQMLDELMRPYPAEA